LPGDTISEVKLTYDKEEPIAIELDPVRLPHRLAETIDRAKKSEPTKWKVTIKVVRRTSDPSDKEATIEKWVELDWQAEWSMNDESPAAPASPMSIPQLGIAYQVDSTVAEEVLDKELKEKIQKGDVIEKIRLRETTAKGEAEKWTYWGKMQSK